MASYQRTWLPGLAVATISGVLACAPVKDEPFVAAASTLTKALVPAHNCKGIEPPPPSLKSLPLELKGSARVPAKDKVAKKPKPTSSWSAPKMPLATKVAYEAYHAEAAKIRAKGLSASGEAKELAAAKTTLLAYAK